MPNSIGGVGQDLAGSKPEPGHDIDHWGRRYARTTTSAPAVTACGVVTSTEVP